jgi:hypothetical protein
VWGGGYGSSELVRGAYDWEMSTGNEKSNGNCCNEDLEVNSCMFRSDGHDVSTANSSERGGFWN